MPKIQTVAELVASLQCSQDSVVKAMRESPSRVSENYELLVLENHKYATAIAMIQQELALAEGQEFEG